MPSTIGSGEASVPGAEETAPHLWRFGFSRTTALLAVVSIPVGLLVGGVLTVFGAFTVYAGFTTESAILGAVVGVALAANGLVVLSMGVEGLLSLPRLRDWVELDDSGISYCYHDGRREHLAWDEISDTRERHLLQRLEVRSAAGKTIRLEYQLKNFAVLREAIMRLAKRSRQVILPVTVSRPSWRTLLDVVGVLGFLALAGYVYVLGEHLWAAVVLVAIGIASIIDWQSIHAVTLTHDRIILHRRWRSEALSFDQVERVDVADRTRTGTRLPSVFLTLKQGGRRELAGLGESTVELAGALDGLLSTARERAERLGEREG